MAGYQLWGGCFEEEPSSVLRRLNDSLSVDSRLYQEDIRGSKGWARELHRSGHLSQGDHDAIQQGLDKVEKEIEQDLAQYGRLKDPEEDIHSVVERRLHAHAGDAALRLHTARSRNDQSATDTRLWMLGSTQRLCKTLLELITVLVNRAEKETGIIAPGYTHLQRAQPIRWSHFLLSIYLAIRDHGSLILLPQHGASKPTFYTVCEAPPIFKLSLHTWCLRDDVTRLEEQAKRLSRCPLGSGAIAGCALSIDRNRLASDLGFEEITPNSMFAVGSRDHIVEFLNWASLCSLHLSRLAEDLIIYSSQEFGIIRFSDQFSTGSSLMPQKRNPDGLELVRGAAGLMLGTSFAFSCVLKGLPSTYNKDLQPDKELLFSSYDKLLDCLKVVTGSVQTMEVNSAKALGALEASMLATDLAHALVRRGVPFRRAHHLVGAVLRRAAALGVDLQHMPHHEYIAICPDFGSEEELRTVFSWEASVEQYTSVGGTSMSSVQHQLEDMKTWIKNNHV